VIIAGVATHSCVRARGRRSELLLLLLLQVGATTKAEEEEMRARCHGLGFCLGLRALNDEVM
jgi:hypothetical protein